MQGWVGYRAPTSAYGKYVGRVGKRSRIYSFDLCGYGTAEFPDEMVRTIAGLSFGVFDLFSRVESDREALLSAVREVQFTESWVRQAKRDL
jgi:hypothetical protein